ncbi:MAG: helix-turn-helix transcriptional regulator [Flavobacteriaceae bacterium]|jgi:DNA-binding CsgD family transcriptional regulator|nr:helix-turn-helix transcriptional regulator [Flavobacteriaceae bacterium]
MPIHTPSGHIPFFTESTKYLTMGLYYGVSLVTLIIYASLYKIFKYKKLSFNLLLQLSLLCSFVAKDCILYFFPKHQNTIGYLLTWSIAVSLVLLLLLPYPFLRFKHKQQFYRFGIIALFSLSVIELIINIIFGSTQGGNVIHPITIILAILSLYLFFILNHKYSYITYISFLLICLSTTTMALTPSLNHTLSHLFLDWPTLRLLSIPLLISSCIISLLEIKKVQERNVLYKRYLYQYMYMVKDYHKQLTLEKKLNKSLSDNTIQLDDSTATDFMEVLKEKYNLTGREFEVLHLLWEGATNKEIADELCISIHTCKYHISKIYLKLDINSRAQIYAFKNS